MPTTLGPEDMARLSSQLDRVRAFMSDHEWHTLPEIRAAVGGMEAAISARLRDLRKPEFGEYIVERRNLGRGLYQYRVLEPNGQALLPLGWE